MTTDATVDLNAPVPILDVTEAVRRRIIDALAPANSSLPTDPETLRVLLQTVDGADRTELSKQKIKADSKSGDDDRKTALMLAKMAEDRMARLGNVNIFAGGNGTAPIPEPDLTLLPTVAITPGLTERGPVIEGYDEFVSRMQSPDAGK